MSEELIISSVPKQCIDLFWLKVGKETPDKCWIWLGAKDQDGYGKFAVKLKVQVASRVSYMIHFGDIPTGFLVCHTCDTPSCVNPCHLFLGTNLDNAKDRELKGRTAIGGRHGSVIHPEKLARGEANGSSKLNAKIVTEIRTRNEAGESKMSIARVFRVSPRAVDRVIRRITWRHVP